MNHRAKDDLLSTCHPGTGALSWLWFAGCLLAVLYGSWLPFRGNFSAVKNWPAIGFHPSGLNDVITNLLVYLPIGFLAAVCGRCARRTRIARVVPAAAFALLCGTLVESVQAAMPARVASWNDVRLNGIGAAIGAALGAFFAYIVPAARHRWRRNFQTAPHATLANMLAPALLLYGLFPFAPAVDAHAIRSALLNARWNPLSVHEIRPDSPPLAAVVQHATDAAWFALLGYLAARGARADGRSAPIAALAATRVCIVVIIVREFLGIFSRYHVFDAGTMLLGAMGAAMGIWMATGLLGPPDPLLRNVRVYARTRRLVWSAVAACQIAALILAKFRPVLAADMTSLMNRFELEPFTVYWRMPLATALVATVPLLISYAVLGLTLAGAIQRSGPSSKTAIAMLVASIALAVEVLRAAGGSSLGDVTNVLLAVGAALTGRWLYTSLTLSQTRSANAGKHPVMTCTGVPCAEHA